MDTGAPRGKAKSEINVTPLIDVVLVLLIVFIVLVPGLTKALPVAVPRVVKTGAPPPDPHNPPLVVSVDEQGGLLLQSDRIELARLADALTPVVQLQPAGMRRVFLKVDGEQPWQKVVDVLDQIRVASERARKETAARPEWGGRDGGDIKVAITLRR
jgi:biopolymer transport protein ExbD